VSDYNLDLCFFCKSFGEDVARLEILLRSIDEHNIDQIPFLLSVPALDRSSFIQRFGSRVADVLEDESLVDYTSCRKLSGWRDQQVVKLAFSESNIARNYIVIDSDCIFFRDFRRSDFLCSDGAPFLVVSKRRYRYTPANEFLRGIIEGKSNSPCPLNVDDVVFREGASLDYDFSLAWSKEHRRRKPEETLRHIPDMLGRISMGDLGFLPPPIVWSSYVLEHLKRYLVDRNGATWSDLIMLSPWEAAWYGEWLLRTRTIPVHAREPYFLHFSTDDDIEDARSRGYSRQRLKTLFTGVAMAQRHQHIMEY
jgi:hypothetical protein